MKSPVLPRYFRGPVRNALLCAALFGTVAMPTNTAPAQNMEQKSVVTPAGGRSLLPKDDLKATGVVDGIDENDNGSAQLVKVNGPTFQNAIRAISKKRGNSWDRETRVNPNAQLRKGEVVLVRFWARALQTSDESGQGLLGAGLGETSPP